MARHSFRRGGTGESCIWIKFRLEDEVTDRRAENNGDNEVCLQESQRSALGRGTSHRSSRCMS